MLDLKVAGNSTHINDFDLDTLMKKKNCTQSALLWLYGWQGVVAVEKSHKGSVFT